MEKTDFSPASTLLQRVARAAVVLLLTGSLGLAAAYQFGTEQTWWIELLRYLPFLVYVVPALVVLGLSLLLPWSWRLAALAGLGVLMTDVMDLSVGLTRESAISEAHAAGGQPLRLMTYNVKSYRAVWRRNGFDMVAEEIGSHDPDIVVMQDAHELVRRGLPDEMRAVLPNRKIYAHGQYMIVSRLPLRDCKPHDMSFRDRNFDFVRCTVGSGRSEFDLVVAHFMTPRGGLNATRHEKLDGVDDWQQNFADRLQQAEHVAQGLRERRRPVIVAGDLNAPEHSPVVGKLLATGLRDAFSTAGRGYGYTVGHALKPGLSFLRIDHILASAEIQVRRCITGWRGASEHRPVIADLQLPA